jgi:hypothetical protein
MCPICIAVAGLFTAIFRPRIRLRRANDLDAQAWRLDADPPSDARDAG